MAAPQVVVSVVCFALGMVLQACLMLRGAFRPGDLLKAAGAILIGALGMLPGRHEHEYGILRHVLFSLAVGGMGFAYLFRDRILTRIGGRVLLAWNILLVFVVLRAGWNAGGAMLLVLIPTTILTVFNAFTDLDRAFGWKVFFHAWFTTILVVVALAAFDARSLGVFGRPSGEVVVRPPLEMIASGAAFLYIVANAWYVLALIPIKGRTQSWSDRMSEIRRHMQLLARGYVWEKDDPLRSLAVLVGLPAALATIAVWGAGNDRAVIQVAITLMPWVAGPVPKPDASAPGPRPRRRR